eukprot:Plantae.Rhodophyta-Purpureofilum_apyrenoidigerum.ctg1578.p1 GENE.Plantae.Rhodophyta-Purpureofilum_apyrenoidigerum.ctg1578~~Plantae.Rhodophyta-Purpureofilum_apyrenoidigerum.ctg1578.p1  ORF type:complete len:394 (-),score=43.99 Plantae.Rhodophyta-Purpureofilum_apyrenoidigerum.ctg1578:2140-3231(-)
MEAEEDRAPCCGCLCCERLCRPCIGRRGVTAVRSFESSWWQQQTWSLKMFVYYKNLLWMYLGLAVILTAVGAVLVISHVQVVESKRLRYDNYDGCRLNDGNQNTTGNCVIPFTFTKEAKGPIYFYYGITGLHQGSRTYVHSISYEQIRGEYDSSGGDTASCDPRVTPNPSMPNPIDAVDPNNVLLPCGVIPWSIFNDTVQVFRDEALQQPLQVSTDEIVYAYEREKVFVPGSEADGYTQAVNDFITSTNFIIWARASVFPVFQKPLYRIEETLQAGTYYASINSAYPVEDFNGQKFVFATTLSFLGTGKSLFLLVAYFVFAGLCLLMAVWIAVEMKLETKRPNDMPNSDHVDNGQEEIENSQI